MPHAVWNDVVLAEAPEDDIELVEGNVYFPPDAVNEEYFRESDTTTVCPWKGTARYYDVVVNGDINEDAAWYYPNPKEAASQIEDRIAFWHGVTVER